MIRREIHLSDQQPQWLLISQIEHARLSGVLAEHCLSHLDKAIREELRQAIIHHDDGWADWEQQPQLDPQSHRPLSFRELPLEESLSIWTKSIDVAETIDAKAAWVVSGHFLALLEASKESLSKQATQWQQQMVARRSRWFSAWRSSDGQSQSAVANEALSWLRLLDVISLWLCCNCPGQGERFTEQPNSYTIGPENLLPTKLSFENGQPRIRPWRLAVSDLQLEVAGWLVPIREYQDAEDLLSARTAHTVHWKISDTE